MYLLQWQIFVAPKLINIVNYTLASLGIDQFIEVKSDFVTAKNGETVYAHYSKHSNLENKIYLISVEED